jgi:hypothetical protein
MIAVVDQERAIAGLGSLNGAGQTLPELYQVYKATPTDFHDITSGNSIGGATYAPQTGYDLATGLGSPVGASLVPALVGVAAPTVTGISPTAGPLAGGTSVTITGTNLTDAMAVNFGATVVTIFTSDTGTQIVLNSPAGGAGTVDVTVVTPGGTSATSTADQFSYLAAPTVTNVLVSSTNWSSTFLSSLASLSSRNVGGYSIPVGSGAQLATLPWGNINQIEVVFSENVTVNQADLLLSGVNTAAYNVSDGTFSYNPSTFTATWTLPQSIGPDKLMLALNADGSNPIEDAAGNRLDGEWTNPASTSDSGGSIYPSGNGVAGGNFDFRFNVLPGDANQDGSVNFADLNKVLTNYNLTGMSWSQGDVTGDGAVNFSDLNVVLTYYNLSLPSGSPAAGAFPAADLLVAATMPTTVNGAITVPSQAGVVANVAAADNRGPEGPDVLAVAVSARPALVQNKASDVFHASAAQLSGADNFSTTVERPTKPSAVAIDNTSLRDETLPAANGSSSLAPGKNATNLEQPQDQVASALADRVRAHDAVLTGEPAVPSPSVASWPPVADARSSRCPAGNLQRPTGAAGTTG